MTKEIKKQYEEFVEREFVKPWSGKFDHPCFYDMGDKAWPLIKVLLEGLEAYSALGVNNLMEPGHPGTIAKQTIEKFKRMLGE